MNKNPEQLWKKMDDLFQEVISESYKRRVAIQSALNLLRNDKDGEGVRYAIKILENADVDREGWDG